MAGGKGGGGGGGAGGTGFGGDDGSNGSRGSPGGGGGGAGGGNGGNGGNGAAGGAGGTSTSKDGGAGANASAYSGGGGGGGGGGANGYEGRGTALNVANATFAGGNGGAGGSGAGGFGGGGGAGGYGAVVGGNIDNVSSVTGGAGGDGGGVGGNGGDGGIGLAAVSAGQIIINQRNGSISGGAGGSAGSGGSASRGLGGAGIAFTNTGSGATFTNVGTIIGGSGRVGGTGVAFAGAGAKLTNRSTGTITGGGGGTGGAGVSGSGLTVVNAGAITGGTGTTQGDAVTFTGGANVLALGANASFTGALNIQSGTLTFNQGAGASGGIAAGSDATVATPIIGAGAVIKAGTGTLTFTADNTYTRGTTVSAGTLQLGDGTTNGSVVGAITNNSVLALSPNGTQTFANAVSGSGALSKIGTGTAVLTGVNTYAGGTSVNGGTLSVSSDANLGAASGGLNLAGTLETTAGFASARAVTLDANSFVQVDSGTLALSGTVSGNGILTKSGAGTLVLSGTNTHFATSVTAGTLSVSADANLGNGSSGLFLGGGTLETTASFSSGRTITLSGTGTVQVDAGTTVLSGPVVDQSGFFGSVSSTLVKTGGGTLTLSGANTYSGGTHLQAGTLDLSNGNAAGTGAISFQASAGGSATLVLETSAQPTSGTFANTLDSFGDGEALVLKGFAFNAMSTKVTYDPTGKILSVTNGTATQNFNMSNADPDDSGAYYAHDDGAGGTRIDNVVCFATGTMIRTVRGDVAVETLTIGDLAVTASGAARAIKWVGTRSFDCAAHPQPAMVRPVRIAAGAFGAGRPYRELMLSPHHAVAVTCLNEVLIPIRLLVNGSSIAQIEDASAITYWHVELDSHDILLANGLPAESYIDVGNRCDFEGEASLTLHPRFESDPLAAYCRPLVTGGGVLAAVRAQLAALVAEDAVTSPAPFHLLVDGTPIPPVVKGDAAAFAVPAGAQDIRLVSPAWSPREADPSSTDDRSLGLMIQALTLEDLFGTATPIPLDHPSLAAGFHPVERNATSRWRWTDGDALIDLSRLGGTAGPFVMRLSGRFAVPQSQTRPIAVAA